MAQKSSFFLAVLLIANPFMLLFFQNCSAIPQASKSSTSTETKEQTPPASQTKEVVQFNFKNPS